MELRHQKWVLYLNPCQTISLMPRSKRFASRIASVPINQLAMQKMVINSAVEEKINQTQRLATLLDGMTRHSPEGLNFKARVEEVGWKQAVNERDNGTYDWTQNEPFEE